MKVEVGVPGADQTIRAMTLALAHAGQARHARRWLFGDDDREHSNKRI
jgi:hypothetical protein